MALPVDDILVKSFLVQRFKVFLFLSLRLWFGVLGTYQRLGNAANGLVFVGFVLCWDYDSVEVCHRTH